jgi:ABC-type nitrate/sulfonate/bicarbonate transport system substrate-binding protein
MRPSHKRKARLIAIILAALAVVVWLLKEREQAAPNEIVIKIAEGGTAPTEREIAKLLTGKDAFKEAGVKLQIIPASASAGWTSPMALLSGQIDVGGGSLAGWINIRARGGKIKALIPGGVVNKEYRTGILVLENSPIHSVKDLAGKSISVNTLGLGGDFLLKLLLRRNGVPLNQVQEVVAPTESQLQLLLSKQINAVADTLCGGVWFDRALDLGGIRLLPGTGAYEIMGEEFARTPSGFREDFIQAHPQAVRGYVTAVEKIRRDIWEIYQKDPERIRKAYAKIAESKGGNPKLAKYFRPTPPGIFMTDRDVQWWLDIMVAEGKLKPGQVKASEVYTNEFNPGYREDVKNAGGSAR